MRKKGKKLSEERIQQHMEAYSDATVTTLLDRAFGLTDSTKSGHQAERGDHIIIDPDAAHMCIYGTLHAKPPLPKNSVIRL